MFPHRQPLRRLRLLLIATLGAVGLALIIIGLGGSTGWLLIAPGLAAVVVSLPGIYLLRRPEIERAATAAGRGRAVPLRHDPGAARR